VAQPEGSHRIKIGILLARQVDDLAEWLADAGAFDAAGADALWIDLADAQELDPIAITAGLAAVTVRSMLVAVLPSDPEASPASARALATIERLSRGRLRIVSDIPSGSPVAPNGRAARNQEPTARGYDLEAAEAWTLVSCPDGRAAWRAKLVEAAEQGFHGLLVPADPRLIDILRNPDDAGGRMDLYLAQG
jgi:alkanesulfonate monooxygenase SsuD/methylene tetrahydromethanopterin reductase-like flavin-dependent oxidoreductase (luciferase family)